MEVAGVQDKVVVHPTVLEGTKKPTLDIDGFLLYYHKDIQSGAGKAYRCDNYRQGCRVRVHQSGQHYEQFGGDHHHVRPESKGSRKRVCSTEVTVAKRSMLLTTNAVLTETEATLGRETTATGMVSTESEKRTMRRDHQRLYSAIIMGDISKATAFTIPPALQVNKRDERLLLSDTRIGDGEGSKRLVIFGSPLALQILVKCRTWLMDGTFKSCPEIFTQIYTIHGVVIDRKSLPLIFAYLPAKNQLTYKTLLQTVKENLPLPQPNAPEEVFPQYIITDFEKAAINAIRDVSPEPKLGLFVSLETVDLSPSPVHATSINALQSADR
uniref:Uncharacterized protein LOC114342346 isoform X2 n=1 Tax=Diabrotica virgifera virgifera TaxID=50390 RepID=A0A6P7GGP6_DIAVI